MKITNLEELLQALSAKKIFKADGTLTKQAEKAYDKLVNILAFGTTQGFVEKRSVDLLDGWMDDAIRNEIQEVKFMKEYKNSNHQYNVLYALPRINQHSISCKYYKWCAATYENGEWEDLLKIDGKYYKITDKTIKNA